MLHVSAYFSSRHQVKLRTLVNIDNWTEISLFTKQWYIAKYLERIQEALVDCIKVRNYKKV
jgi:hypothetical protein